MVICGFYVRTIEINIDLPTWAKTGLTVLAQYSTEKYPVPRLYGWANCWLAVNMAVILRLSLGVGGSRKFLIEQRQILYYLFLTLVNYPVTPIRPPVMLTEPRLLENIVVNTPSSETNIISRAARTI